MAGPEKREGDAGMQANTSGGVNVSPGALQGSATPVASGSPTERFDDILARLRGVVEKLEGGNLSLEDSLKFFEEGIGLCRRGATILDSAERKVEVLLGASSSGGGGGNAGSGSGGSGGSNSSMSGAPRTIPFDVPAGDED